MKQIKIAFADFWDWFDKNNNFITDILKTKYDVCIVDTDVAKKNEIEYLFYSCMGREHYQYDCVKIFYTGECVVPDFNECDYAIGFDYLTLGDRYMRYPLYLADYMDDVKRMLDITKENVERPSKFCAMVVSNSASASPFRKIFFDKLSEYKRVDSGGRFLNNIGIPQGVENKFEFLRKYKFSLALENCSYPGYCTEKIVQAFAAGTIPVYWGDPTVTNTFNKNAFIYIAENNLEAGIQKIIDVDNDDAKYMQMRKESPIINEKELPQVYESELETWLFHIFDQEYREAYRRCLYGRVKDWADVRNRRDEFMRKYSYLMDEPIHRGNRIKQLVRLMVEK